jgi:tetratricopeptide (TPR) repeat protein
MAMTTEWYRNTTWNESIELVFEEKLRRARNKHQYLRIQACTLAQSHPEVAIRLLDRYFELPADFELAQANVDRATAFLALGRVAEAIASYEAALAREADFPNVLTRAYLELPYLVATHGIREQYDRAIQILQSHEACLTFPVDRFQWHAAHALIAADSGKLAVARAHGERSLEAASYEHSGFRYHPTVGLVTGEYKSVIKKLKAYRAAEKGDF